MYHGGTFWRYYFRFYFYISGLFFCSREQATRPNRGARIPIGFGRVGVRVPIGFERVGVGMPIGFGRVKASFLLRKKMHILEKKNIYTIYIYIYIFLHTSDNRGPSRLIHTNSSRQCLAVRRCASVCYAHVAVGETLWADK